MNKVRRLRPGSRIAVISPSSGLPHVFPAIYELGLRNLREVFGFEVVDMPHARMSPDDLYRHPEWRAEDVNQCFADDTIDGIIASIGGYESIRILPYLDTDLIMKHPKFMMGFSDTTTLLAYFNTLGMVTFYGPTIMAGLAQMQHLPPTFTQHMLSIFFSLEVPYNYPVYPEWTDGYQDWRIEETLGQCKDFHANPDGPQFLQGNHAVTGTLFGGSIEVLEFMKSTRYWPKDTFWDGKILFFETSEEHPSPQQVGYMLRNYGMQGVFPRIRGLLFGRAAGYTIEEKQALNEIVLRIVHDEFGAEHIPIVTDIDFGHTVPSIILPLGARIRIDVHKRMISLLDDPFYS